jgi:DNA-binding CsgD family transcriptional regulator
VLALLSQVEMGADAPADAWLLRSRSLLRLRRPEQVIEEMTRVTPMLTGVDERATAAMLHAAALARLDASAGGAALARVAKSAVRERAHPAIRAEITYYRALTAWSADDLTNAERFARVAERDGRDVLSVRAIQLRAFIAARTPGAARYVEALDLFRAAARGYSLCRERDTDLAAAIAQQTAALEQTLRSAQIPGTHRTRRGRRVLPGAAFTMTLESVPALRMCYDDAWLFALDGDGATALARMHEAATNAPTPAWRAWSLAGAAAIAAFFGENASARVCADTAAAIAQGIDWNATRANERLAYLHLAEVYAIIGCADAAGSSLRAFDVAESPAYATMMWKERDDDPRLRGWYAYVLGLVRRGEGDFTGAAAAFTAAAEAFASCGYLWREALALLEVGALAHPGASGQYLDRAVAIVREHFPQSFLARRLGWWTRSAVDPLLATLSPAEREVLLHLLEGRAPREIAEATGRSYNTVRTQVQSVHRKLGTSSDLQVVVACARRGVGAPSWALASTSSTAAG